MHNIYIYIYDVYIRTLYVANHICIYIYTFVHMIMTMHHDSYMFAVQILQELTSLFQLYNWSLKFGKSVIRWRILAFQQATWLGNYIIMNH